MIFAYIKTDFDVYIKIVVGDNVSHPFDLVLFNLRVLRQKCPSRKLVQIFQAFTVGDQPHADRIQFFHAPLRIGKIIGRLYRLKSLADSGGGLRDLSQNIQNLIPFIHKRPLYQFAA